MKKTIVVTLLCGALIQAALPGQPAFAAPLDDRARQALEAALADEHHAEAFYDAVIARFGPVRPFVSIIEAERTHAAEIGAVMATYGLTAGTNVQLGDKSVAESVPATIAEACRMGVEAEIANRDLYDSKLIPAAAGHADIVALFKRLRDASENNHLPAFTRCGAGGGGAGKGPNS